MSEPEEYRIRVDADAWEQMVSKADYDALERRLQKATSLAERTDAALVEAIAHQDRLREICEKRFQSMTEQYKRAEAAEAELARLRHPTTQHVIWRAATLLEWCAESIRQAAPVPNGFPFIPELQEIGDKLRALARSLITDPPVERKSDDVWEGRA